MKLRPFHLPLILWYAAILHLWWAGLLWLSPSAADATTTAALTDCFSPRYVSVALVVASVMSLTVLYRARAPSIWTALCLLPQQALLTLAAVGAVEAIWASQFADGVIRSRYFIAADQFPPILAAVFHNFAVVSYHARGFMWKTSQQP